MQSYQDILFQVQAETEQVFFRVPDSYKSEFSNGDSEDPFLEFLPWPIKVSRIIFGDGTEQSTAGGGGGGQNQTPWLSDIDADGFSLENVASVGLANGNPLLTFTNTVLNINTSYLYVGVPGVTRIITLESGEGRLGIANPTPTFRLDVTGDININDPGGANGYAFRINGMPIGGGGGSQTPWLSDIDADGFRLSNITNINGITTAESPYDFIITSAFNVTLNPPAGWFVNVWGRLNVTGYANFTGEFLNVTGALYVGGTAVIGNNSPTQGVFISAQGPRGFLSGGNYGAYTELDINGAPLLLNRRDLGYALVGVGVFNPQYMLDVFQDINITSSATIGGLGALSFTNSLIPSTDQRVVMLFAQTENTEGDSGLLAFYTSNTGVLSERMRLNSQGNLGIGTATPLTPLHVNRNASALAAPPLPPSTVAMFSNADSASCRVMVDAYVGSGTSFTPSFTCRVAGGTAAAPTAILAGQAVGIFNTWGYNGSAYAGSRGGISVTASEAWTTTANGTYMSILATPAGSVAVREVARFTGEGRLGVGPISSPSVSAPAYTIDADGDINCTGTFRVNGVPVAIASAAEIDELYARMRTLERRLL